jgi:inosose dehydratase
MKIGFGTQLWLAYDNMHNLPRMLDEMSLVGLDGFEMCYPLLVERYEQRVAELRSLLAMHDLELASYYAGCTFSSQERLPGELEEVRRRCRFVAELGSTHVLLDGGSKIAGEAPTQTERRVRMVAESANALAAYAHSLGLTLSWHQHWGSIFEDESVFHRLMELTDPALVRFCPDVGQLTLCGMDAVRIVRRYAGRIGFVHYKDITFAGRPQGSLWPGGPAMPADGGAYGVDSRGRWVELGRGVVDFAALTAVLREAGYDGWLVDDFDYSGYEPRASAQACKDYLNLGLGIWGERDRRRGLAPQGA